MCLGKVWGGANLKADHWFGSGGGCRHQGTLHPPQRFAFFFGRLFFLSRLFFLRRLFFLCRRLRCVSSDGSSLTLTGVLIIWRRVCRHGVGGSVYGLLDGSIVLRDFGLLLEAGDFCLGWTCGGQATCVVVWWCMVVVV